MGRRVDALEEAIATCGAPAIVNTDQGAGYERRLHQGGPRQRSKLSLDGRGCWHDNIFIERLWRSLKYEEVYLHAYDTVSAAKRQLGRYITLYNSRRPHSSLAGRPPDEAYFAPLPLPVAA